MKLFRAARRSLAIFIITLLPQFSPLRRHPRLPLGLPADVEG